MEYKDLQVGTSFSTKKVITLADVKKFAELSGDYNPVHLDEDFASKSIFKKPIIHGMIIGAIFSKAIASDLPGPGSIYLNQELNFLKPVYHNSELEILIEVNALKPEKKIVFLSTVCKVNDELVVKGSAVVKCLN